MSNNDIRENSKLTDFTQQSTEKENNPNPPESENVQSESNVLEHIDQRRSLIETNDVNLKTGSKIATQCFLEEINTSIAESTAKKYAGNMRGFVEWFEKNSLTSIDDGDIRAYLRKRARNDRRERTLEGDLSAIKRVCKWMKYETDLTITIDFFALDDISVSNYQTPTSINREPLNQEELEKLYNNFDCFRNRLMTMVAGETGSRNVDVTKIKINDVDFDDLEIVLNNTKCDRRYKQPISDELAVDIKHFIAQRRESYNPAPSNDYLFPSNQGGKISRQHFNRLVKSAAEKAGIQEVIGSTPRGKESEDTDRNEVHRVTPHTLRHTFNNRMDKAGISISERANALDQDSIEINRKYYTADSEEYKKEIRKELH